MKKSTLVLALALGASTWSLSAQDQGGSSSAGDPAPSQLKAPDGSRGSGVPGRPGGFRLLPPRAMKELNLTEAQRKQLADLEKEVKAKVEKILTPEQLEKMKEMRPPLRPPGPGMGGPGWGGPPPGGPGMGGQRWGGPPPGGPRMGGPGRGGPGGPQGGPEGEGLPQRPPPEQ